MFIAITGTPGTGKTSVSKILRNKTYSVIDLNALAKEKQFIFKKDVKRDSDIIDVEKLNDFVLSQFTSDDTIFIEGHLSHLLDCIDNVIILRMHPSKLRKNLESRKWSEEKINENLQAEIIDVILIETIEKFDPKNIFEIDTTDKKISEVADIIVEIHQNKFKNIKNYKIGQIDWSEEIFKNF